MILERIVAAGLIACVLCPAVEVRASDPPLVDTPKVLAGDYVDTTSMEGIVGALFKSKTGWSDERKILNFYHWYRRLVYPYRYMASDRRDVLKALNTAGFSLCGSQAAVVVTMLKAGGYETRVVSGNGGPEWGHTFWEVKYDNRWHLFDTMTAFYVLTRDNPPHVASGDELEADPTLVTQAIEEKRCGPEFLYTIRKHEITLAQREQFRQETKGADVPWSLLVTKPGSLLDFWTRIAEKKKIRVSTTGTYGGKCTPNVLDIKLKANERYVRLWSGPGKWLTTASFIKYSPQNMAAGDNEHFDVVNFKYFEPYRRAKPNPWNEAVYRTYGNGYLEWKPASADQLAQGVSQRVNLKGDPTGALTVEDPAKPAEMFLPVKSPYGVVEIELQLDLKQPAGASTELQLLTGRRRKKVWRADGAVSSVQTIVIPTHEANPPIYECLLKVVTQKGQGAKLAVGRLKTTFQLNPMALPGLVPGANRIRVSAAEPGKLVGGTLLVTYDWLEAPDWKTKRSDTHELAELPTEYEIKLPAGEKLPKMQRLELFLKPQ